jgi:TrmH family RNA methyltransferase
MTLQSKKKQSVRRSRADCFVLLVRPESPENIGLAARAMKNTGFESLRLVGLDRLNPAAFRTAVHAEDVLSSATFYPDLAAAVADLNVVFASTARPRQNFFALSLDEAVSKMQALRPPARIGLVFGNERTGLTSAELALSNFRFTIPQASRQPSYNLGAAVLITLFEVFRRYNVEGAERGPLLAETPLPFTEQDECLRLILRKLADRRFIHATNARHTTEMVRDLLGRLAITARDRRLLLAMFSHAGKGPSASAPRAGGMALIPRTPERNGAGRRET